MSILIFVLSFFFFHKMFPILTSIQRDVIVNIYIGLHAKSSRKVVGAIPDGVTGFFLLT